MYPEKNEKAIDITFLMHKALKIMRENPDLEVQIHLVPTETYVYVDGEDGQLKWVPSHYTTEDKKKQ